MRRRNSSRNRVEPNDTTESMSTNTLADTSRTNEPQIGAHCFRDNNELEGVAITSKGGHRRGFSFAPGDDFTDSVLLDQTFDGRIGHPTSTAIPVAAVSDLQTKHLPSHSLRNASASGSIAGVKPYRHPLDAFNSVSEIDESSKFGQPYGSGKSVLTAFRGGSGHSLLSSHRGSIGSIMTSDNGIDTEKRKGNSHFAIAAARAAKNVAFNGKAIQRHAGA